MRSLGSLVCVFALAACSHSWQEIESADGRFRAVFPGDPRERTEAVHSDLGKLQAHFTIVDRRGGAFMVCWCDYPEIVVDAGNTEAILDGARDGAAARVHGTVVRDEVTTIGTVTGRSFEIHAPDGAKVRARICMVGPRLYQAIAAGDGDFSAAPDGPRFLESFEVTAPAAAPAR